MYRTRFFYVRFLLARIKHELQSNQIKSDGMSREVFALTGGAPSLVSRPKITRGLKDKRKLKDQKVNWYSIHPSKKKIPLLSELRGARN